jgi:signal transduction histidine kinase
MVYRWRRPERYSRFRVKLTLSFILFLMLPTIPLVFVAGFAVDQARGLLVALPLDDSLEHGLAAVRLALADEEARLDAWRAGILDDSPPPAGDGVDFTMRFAHAETGWTAADLQLLAPLPEGIEADSLRADLPDPRSGDRLVLDDADFLGDEQVLFRHRGAGIFMALVKPDDVDHLEAAGVWIDPGIVEARESLDAGLSNFGRMNLYAGRSMQEVVWMLASIWLVVLAVGAFWTTGLLSRGVSDPVVALARGMEQVAAGDLDARLTIRAKDEMAVLVESFNAMTSDLQEARSRIVTAEKQAAWRDVARRIAHEIKNPLTPLRIGLHRIRGRLQSEGIWEEDQGLQESIQTMTEEVEALQRMAATFSEFAELPQPTMTEGDPGAVVRAAAALFQEGPHRAVLHLRIAEDLPRVRMDAEQVKRAVINLVKNAVESVEEGGGGHVHVRLERADEGLLLEVRDDGAGFEPGAAERLFDPDFSTKQRGTGLGLSVVSRIVADHGWRIEATSAGRGQGAVIRLWIPIAEEVSP